MAVQATRNQARPKPGFGRAILEQVVPRALNGRATYNVEADRVCYRIDWPETPAG